MKVKDVMRTDIITIKKGMNLKEVVRIFSENKLHSAPVVDESNVVVGMVSIKDILKVLLLKYLNAKPDNLTEENLAALYELRSQNPQVYDNCTHRPENAVEEQICVESVMSQNVKSAKEDDSILLAIMAMYTDNIVRMPVTKNDKAITGILSQSDILRATLQLWKGRNQQ